MGHAAVQAGDIAGADESAHIVQEVCNPAHLPSCASCISPYAHSRLPCAGLPPWARAPVLYSACGQSMHLLSTSLRSLSSVSLPRLLASLRRWELHEAWSNTCYVQRCWL